MMTESSGRFVVRVDFNDGPRRLKGRGFANLDDMVIARDVEGDIEADAVVVAVIPPGSGYGRNVTPLLILQATTEPRHIETH